MRFFAWVGLIAAAMVTGQCIAEEPADTRAYWVCEGGWFAKSKDGSWYEMNELTHRKLGKPVVFKEVKRTKESVELFDEDRKIGVRLSEDGSEVKLPGKEWEKLYKGRWKSPDE
jgi:hypothetical protein